MTRKNVREIPAAKIVVLLLSSIFGRQLDIHSGGVDLAFPHHENEIAQSEAYHQCRQWANYFLHSGGFSIISQFAGEIPLEMNISGTFAHLVLF